MLGRIAAWAAAASLVVATAAGAANSVNTGALGAGAPAGVKEAVSWGGQHQLLWLVGGGAIIGGIILVATGNGHGSVSTSCPLTGCTPTTTTTTTTPTTTTTTTTTTSTGTK